MPAFFAGAGFSAEAAGVASSATIRDSRSTIARAWPSAISANEAMIYTPGDVAERMGISGQRLRQLARSYERVHGDLPRDERGRVWPEGDVEALERTRDLVRIGRASGIEQALRGELLPEGAETHPANREPGAGDIAAVARLAGEIGALRAAVEDQNRIMLSMVERLEALEGENWQLREVSSSPTEPPEAVAVTPPSGEDAAVEIPTPTTSSSPHREPGIIQRVRGWLYGRSGG